MELEAALAEQLAPTDGPQKSVAWFRRIADAAIRHSVLEVNGERFAILEIEFYLHRPGHEDPYVHQNAQQLGTSGAWYFHREKAARLGFTLKGVDLTFGVPGSEYGGMLIRALAHSVGGGSYVEGPSKVVDTILIAAGVSSVAELKQDTRYRDSAFAADGLVRFDTRGADDDDASAEVIRCGPRIGLRKTASPYWAAPYRFRARAALTKKDKAGILRGGVVEVSCPASARPATPLPALTDEDVDELLADLLGGEG